MRIFKFNFCVSVMIVSLCLLFANLRAQIFENSEAVKFFNNKVIQGLNFVESNLWVSTQSGVYRYNINSDRIDGFYFFCDKSESLNYFSVKRSENIRICNIITNGKTTLFCDYLNEKLLKLENDSIKYLNLRSYANINGLISSLNVYNTEIWFVVGEDLFYGNHSSNIYYLRNNQLYEYENPFGKIHLESLILIITDDSKYFVGVEFDKDRKIYVTRLIIKSGETTILNSEIDTNRQRVEYKTYKDSERIFLLDNLGKFIKIEKSVVEKTPLEFDYLNNSLMINRDYFWFTANKDYIYITNINGLFIYDAKNKFLIKKIVYPPLIVLENILFKDNKIWGSLGPVSTDFYNAYSLGVLDLLKN